MIQLKFEDRACIAKQYIIAILAAPFLWAILYFYWQPQIQWFEPLIHPMTFMIRVIIYPVLEEIVFRGAIQGWLLKQIWGGKKIAVLSYANILTSLLFSCTHLLNNTLLLAFLVFFPSLIFGYFRDVYAGTYYSILAPIVLHVFYNAGWVLLFFY